MLQPTRLSFAFSLSLAVASQAQAQEPLAIPVQDPHAEVRGLLEDGRPEEARRALSRLGDPGASVPGLLGEALEKAGDLAGAQRVYEAAQGGDATVAAAARLRLARASAKAKDPEAAARLWLQVLSGEMFGKEPLLLDEGLAFLVESGKAVAALKELRAPDGSYPLALLPAPGEALRREAYGRALRQIAEHAADASLPEVRDIAIERLYTHLPETKAAANIEALAEGALKKRLTSQKLALARARTLTDRHDNEAVLATLAPFRPKAKDTSEVACEVRYLSGKAARKMRRYKSARRDLDFVAAKCPEPWRKKARYLAALVASFGAPKDALSVLEAFLSAYPKDGYTDDVLVWKAEIAEREGRLDDSATAYREVVAKHPGGDMFDKARFGLALLLAKQGDAGGARAVLDEIARTSLKAPVMVRDQALYWRARLLVFPTFDALTPTADEAQRDEGLRALTSFAAARPASFYGHLARLVALEGATRAKIDPAPLTALLEEATVAPRASLASDLRLTPGPAFQGSEAFRAAHALVRAGFDDEAELLLDRVSTRELGERDRLLLTLLYARARARDKSHRVMRASGYALPEGRPTDDSLLLWTLSFPRAHQDAITTAATTAKLPPELLFGLAREESAFEAEVVSWAGAIGLCQLMPFTAKEEAQRLKIKLASLEELRAPTLNARLGAAHLSRRMSLGHPLLAIAAYNAGPGNVNKWRKALTLRPLDAFVESIPVEQTRNYVKKVTGSWVVYAALDGGKDVVFDVELP